MVGRYKSTDQGQQYLWALQWLLDGPVYQGGKQGYHDRKKGLHSTNNGTSFLQSITYAYNERGWLLNANAPKFDLKLRYQLPTKTATAQYNGNISEMEYTGQYSSNRWFKYSYDNLNRLTNAAYSNAGQLDEVVSYDRNGNISTLKRGSGAVTSYTYAATSNRLTTLSGGRASSYTYDANGSALTDGARNVTLTYNLLNLPATVKATSTGTTTATYTYDAAGAKLRSVQGSNTRDYIGGIQYKANAIEFIATEEGRAMRNTDGTYRYEYTLKDHLGNARVSFDQNGSAIRVIQEDEYHAFGLSRSKYTLGEKNDYLYNSKEKQEALPDVYDYGARFYDPVIGKWQIVDPLAEVMISMSPYVYGNNNPINMIDPDGRLARYNWSTGKYEDGGKEVPWGQVQRQYGLQSSQDQDEGLIISNTSGQGFRRNRDGSFSSYETPNNHDCGGFCGLNHKGGEAFFKNVNTFVWAIAPIPFFRLLNGAKFAAKGGVNLVEALNKVGGSRAASEFLGWGNKTTILKTASDFTKGQLTKAGYTKHVLTEIHSGLMEAAKKTISSTGQLNPASVARANQIEQILKTHFK